MKYLKLFEQFIDFKIGDNTTIGIVDDVTDTQVQINNNWYAKKIITKSDILVKKEPLRNRKTINPNIIVSAFTNPIDESRVEYYVDIFNKYWLESDIEPIKGFPFIINEDDIDTLLMNNEPITSDMIGTYAWKLTDGHHRVLAAIQVDLPYLNTKLEYADPEHYIE